VHVEAGFKLNGSLLREGCVDELLVYQAPILLGSGLGMANIPPFESLIDVEAWNPIDIKYILQDQRVRYLRCK
jgi:diaminohydroxyphosphoribosylaminopyrimidine deaminase/5-amino-6-(5-phosphoribosylamino)uracil reductase